MIDRRVHRLLNTLAACLLPLSFVEAGSVSTGLLQPLNTAKMLDCSGLPCVEVKTRDGKHLKLAVDTGNPSSFLSAQTAKALGLKLTPYTNSAGKIIPDVQMTMLPELNVGTGSLGDLKFAVFDLSKSLAEGTFPAVDGTIAYGAFKQRVLQLDYAARTIGYSAVLQGAQPCPVARCGRISLITFGHDGPPIVVSSGFSVNGKPLSMQIDTMFTGTMLIFPPAVDRLGLHQQSESKVMRHFAFTDEGVDMTEAGPDSESFGGKPLLKSARIYFAGPKVHLPDGLFDGTVGAELLAGHRLSLDFAGMNSWVE